MRFMFLFAVAATSAAASNESAGYSITVRAQAQGNSGMAVVTVNAAPVGSIVEHTQIKVFSDQAKLLSVTNVGGDGTGALVVNGIAATPGQTVQVQAHVTDKDLASRRGVCTASTIVAREVTVTRIQGGLSYPWGITANSTALFWAERWDSPWEEQPDSGLGRIWTAALDGSNPHVIVTGQRAPMGIAADDSALYWLNVGLISHGGEIVKYDLATETVTVLATGENWLGTAIKLVNGKLFWSGAGIRTFGPDNFPIVLNWNGAVNLASDGTNLFWTQYAVGPPVEGNSGRVLQMPLTGGTEIELATGQAQPWEIQTNGTSVFWSNQAWQQPFPATINRVSIGGGEVASVVTDSEGGWADIIIFGIDSEYAYFIDNSTLYAAPLAGGSWHLLATLSEGHCPASLIVRANNIYWTDVCSQVVMRATW